MAAATDYRDDVPDAEKARLLDQHIAAKSSERYSLEAAELAGEAVNETRKKELDDALAKLHEARSKLDV